MSRDVGERNACLRQSSGISDEPGEPSARAAASYCLDRQEGEVKGLAPRASPCRIRSSRRPQQSARGRFTSVEYSGSDAPVQRDGSPARVFGTAIPLNHAASEAHAPVHGPMRPGVRTNAPATAWQEGRCRARTWGVCPGIIPRHGNRPYSGSASMSMQAVMVNVLAMDDRFTHLSRLGARTLCGKLAKYETDKSGEPCRVCAQLSRPRASRSRSSRPDGTCSVAADPPVASTAA